MSNRVGKAGASIWRLDPSVSRAPSRDLAKTIDRSTGNADGRITAQEVDAFIAARKADLGRIDRSNRDLPTIEKAHQLACAIDGAEDIKRKLDALDGRSSFGDAAKRAASMPVELFERFIARIIS